MAEHILFVTYGGGHARMIAPVVRELQNNPDIKITTIALTTGGAIFKSEGLPYKGYRDFITPADTEALAWGKKLAAIHHSPDSGIEEEESIAYLGLSYWDLMTRFSEKEAEQRWQEQGRHAFLQVSVFERIIAQLKPDIVVTTNSPRSERAAVEVANRLGILTLSIADLFGIQHFHALESQYIAVLSEGTIDGMLAEGVNLPRDHFFVTGNPAFDRAFECRGPIDFAWRRQHFPQWPGNAKTLLWIDMPAYWKLSQNELHQRDDAEILFDLDSLAVAAKANDAHLLLRPHPSQQRGIYEKWIKQSGHAHVFFAGDVPLYPLLNAVDVVATYTSTVGVEALLMYRKLIQLKYHPGKTDMPLGELEMAWLAHAPEELSGVLHDALTNELNWQFRQKRIEQFLPQQRSAPLVAETILSLLAKSRLTE